MYRNWPTRVALWLTVLYAALACSTAAPQSNNATVPVREVTREVTREVVTEVTVEKDVTRVVEVPVEVEVQVTREVEVTRVVEVTSEAEVAELVTDESVQVEQATLTAGEAPDATDEWEAHPPARVGHANAYDPISERLYVFGGISYASIEGTVYRDL